MTTEEKAKTPRKRKGVSDRTLYKYTKEAQKRFGLGDDATIEQLLNGLRDAVMDDMLG